FRDEHSAVDAEVAVLIGQRFNHWHKNALADKTSNVQSSKKSVDGATMGRGNGDRVECICQKPALTAAVDLVRGLSENVQRHPMVRERKRRDINWAPQT